MLGVLPFVEDPDLSVTAGRAKSGTPDVINMKVTLSASMKAKSKVAASLLSTSFWRVSVAGAILKSTCVFEEKKHYMASIEKAYKTKLWSHSSTRNEMGLALNTQYTAN